MKNDTFDIKNKTSMISPSPARSGMMAVGNNDYGYFCGGYHRNTPSIHHLCPILKDLIILMILPDLYLSLLFSLDNVRGDGASNLTYGYLFGGIGVNNTKFMRLEFSNGTATLMPSSIWST